MLAIMHLFSYLFILLTASSKKKPSPLDPATSAIASAVSVDNVETSNIDSKSHLENHSGRKHVDMHIAKCYR